MVENAIYCLQFQVNILKTAEKSPEKGNNYY